LLDSEADGEPAFVKAHWTTQRISDAQNNPQEFLARIRQASHQGDKNAD